MVLLVPFLSLDPCKCCRSGLSNLSWIHFFVCAWCLIRNDRLLNVQYAGKNIPLQWPYYKEIVRVHFVDLFCNLFCKTFWYFFIVLDVILIKYHLFHVLFQAVDMVIASKVISWTLMQPHPQTLTIALDFWLWMNESINQ